VMDVFPLVPPSTSRGTTRGVVHGNLAFCVAVEEVDAGVTLKVMFVASLE